MIIAVAAVAIVATVGGLVKPTAKPVRVQQKTTASAQTQVMDAPPVQVLVGKYALGGGQFRYTYRVVNGGAFPVTALVVGYDYFHGAAELPTGPVGLSDTGVPEGSRTTPAGWAFNLIDAEEDTLVQFEWRVNQVSGAIPGGGTLSGFSVLLPQESERNEGGHWTVYLNSAEQSYYSGSLQPDGTTSVPASSILGRNGISVHPNPMQTTTSIAFSVAVAGEVSVRVFDASGRAVKELAGWKLEVGPAKVAWDGTNFDGTRMPAGTYFVRIKTATTERFARFTLVR